jgi:hypothetical protein
MSQIPCSGEHDPLSGNKKLVKLRKRVKGTRGQTIYDPVPNACSCRSLCNIRRERQVSLTSPTTVVFSPCPGRRHLKSNSLTDAFPFCCITPSRILEKPPAIDHYCVCCYYLSVPIATSAGFGTAEPDFCSGGNELESQERRWVLLDEHRANTHDCLVHGHLQFIIRNQSKSVSAMRSSLKDLRTK